MIMNSKAIFFVAATLFASVNAEADCGQVKHDAACTCSGDTGAKYDMWCDDGSLSFWGVYDGGYPACVDVKFCDDADDDYGGDDDFFGSFSSSPSMIIGPIIGVVCLVIFCVLACCFFAGKLGRSPNGQLDGTTHNSAGIPPPMFNSGSQGSSTNGLPPTYDSANNNAAWGLDP